MPILATIQGATCHGVHQHKKGPNSCELVRISCEVSANFMFGN